MFFHNIFNIFVWLMLLPYMQVDCIALADVNAHDIVADVVTLADVITNILVLVLWQMLLPRIVC